MGTIINNERKVTIMKKLLLCCYIIFCPIVILPVGCIDHKIHGHSADKLADKSTVIPYDPLPSRSISPIEEDIFDVVRVVDGDTIIVGDSNDREKQYRVRLIGADTPEVVRMGYPVEPFGQEASDFTKQIITKAGNKVRLAFDGEQVDRFNRTLAMVYLTMPDGTEIWLNELLIREGLAHARLDFRYSHGAKLSFAVAEVEARTNRKNMWKDGENNNE